MTAAVLTEARARLAAAFPGWTDATGDPNPHASNALPLFHIRIAASGSERSGMGEGTFFRDAVLTVILRDRFTPAQDLEAVLLGHAASAEVALLAAPADLGGRVEDITPDQSETDGQTGEFRSGSAELSFGIQLLI